MNILLTSAGRRTSLLLLFQNALKLYGGAVIAADIDPLAPALYLADGAERVSRASESAYISALLGIVERRQIRLLVPTIDTELQVLADHASEFESIGCRIHISSPSFVKMTADKWLTMNSYRREGIGVPRSWIPGGTDLPGLGNLPQRLFVKPRDGSASLHTYGIAREELRETLLRVPNPIIQEEVIGPEITIDAFLDQQGQPIHYVPRLRIRTLGGESIQGVTLDDTGALGIWLREVLTVSGRLGARGAITLQAFDTPQGYLLSEINARFGGGYPLGHAAGGHYPEWLLQELSGEQLRPQLGEYRQGLYMTRSYTEVFTEQLKW